MNMETRWSSTLCLAFLSLLLLSAEVAGQVSVVETQSFGNLLLAVNSSEIELYDNDNKTVTFSFTLAPTNDRTNVTAAVGSVLVSASVYSEWTAQIKGEQITIVSVFSCLNASLSACGNLSLNLQPLRYGRANLLLTFQFIKAEESCTTEDLSTSDQSCMIGFARRLIPIAVVHDRGIFDKIFRYTTISFVLLLTFLMGTQLNIDEVLRILLRPLAPCVGVACQYVGMPLLAICVCQLFFFIPSAYSSQDCTMVANGSFVTTAINSSASLVPQPSASAVCNLNMASETIRNAMLAFGLLALGCAPGGGASNTWTVLLHGDLQLSMSLTFFSTVLSFGMMPLWLFCLTPLILRHLPHAPAGAALNADATLNSSLLMDLDFTSSLSLYPNTTSALDVSPEHQLRVPYVHIVYQLLTFVVPCVAGVLLRKFLPKVADRFRIPLKCTSGFFVLFMVTYGMWVHRYVFLVVVDDPRLFAFTAALPYLGYMIGYGVAFAAVRSRPQAVAVAVETGIQNMSIAVLIVKYNLPSPASDLGTVVLILVALIGPLPLYLIFSVLLIRKRCAERRARRHEKQTANDDLRIELEGAKLTDAELYQLEKDGKLGLEMNGKYSFNEKHNADELNSKLIESTTTTTTEES